MSQLPQARIRAARCLGVFTFTLLFGAWLAAGAQAADLSVNAAFPGGNIVVEKIDGNTVWLRQDLRDTPRFWFYWLFEVRGGATRTVEFRFTNGEVFGSRGPAISRDGGRTWTWLGTNACEGQSFRYSFAREEREVRFGFTIPYTQRELDTFLTRFAGDAALRVGTLGQTPKGRAVEWLRAGRVDGQAPYRVLITSRHHACESMANFAAEGLLEQVLSSEAESAWFRENTEICFAPFLDKDGVEEGDQGKLRQPHDHWLDYGGESRYTAVRALRARFNPLVSSPVQIALDLHCPSLRDEKIYLATAPDARLADNTFRFSQLLEQRRQGPLAYRCADNLLFGQGWNRTEDYGSNHSFMHWAATLPGSEVVATVELPYAAVGSIEVTPDSARAFGKDLASALRAYLEPRAKTTTRSFPPRGRTRLAGSVAGQSPSPGSTNTWTRVVNSGSLAGAPWPRHTIDATSRGADGVKLADVDRDGRPDIITGWEEGGEIRLYRNPGALRCREPWPRLTLAHVRSPEDAILADLDGDGRLDGISATEGTERTVFVHWSPREPNWVGDTTWETHALPITRGQQMWMFLLPLQLDGQAGIDLVAGSKGEKGDAGAIGWLQAPSRARDLDGWRWHPLRKAGWVMSLLPVDLDADGDADILFSDRKGPGSGVGWLQNPGPAAATNQGAWTEHLLGARGREVMFLDAGDLDGDGFPEIAAAVKPSEILVLRRQPTDWKEEWIHVDAHSGHAKAVRMADLNQDGRTDLIFSCEGATGPLRGVIWLRREEHGWRARDLSGLDGLKFDLVETLDVDGDGDADVLTCEEAENLGVFWYENPGRQ